MNDSLVWITEDGERVRLDEMDESHLRNILHMVLRRTPALRLNVEYDEMLVLAMQVEQLTRRLNALESRSGLTGGQF